MYQPALENRLSWIRRMTPITRLAIAERSAKRFDGVRLAVASHIEPKMLPPFEFLLRHGVTMSVAPCVPGIAHPDSFEYLENLGASVFGLEAKSWNDLEAAWAAMAAGKPDFVFDIGGGLIASAARAAVRLRAASEVTTSGITRIRPMELSFPVFDWNATPLKSLMHNRYEVGSGLWYAFRRLTDLDVCRLSVGVLGFGPVGQSVASTARGLGARVAVTDIDPVREMTAASEGFVTGHLHRLLPMLDVLITATGKPGVVSRKDLSAAREGLILANVGHGDGEIDTTDFGSPAELLEGVSVYRLGNREVSVLVGGRLLNLAGGGGSATNTFDLMTALLVAGLDFMLTSGPQGTPGIHVLPAHVEAEVAEIARRFARYPD